MAKYVNLSRAGTGYAGTDLDPFSYPDFKTDVETAGAETYNLQGEIETSNNYFNPKGNQVYQAWNLSLYGPFRMRDLNNALYPSFYLNGDWTGAILEFFQGFFYNNDFGIDHTWKNCFITLSATEFSEINCNSGNLYFKGCTLRAPFMKYGMGSGFITQFIDSVIDIPVWQAESP